MPDIIDVIIEGSYVDPETGDALGVPTQRVVIEKDLTGQASNLVGSVGMSGKLAVVCDRNTYAAMGERIWKELSGRGESQLLDFGDSPHADEETATRLIAETSQCDGLVAVGSGTINDLCKYASAEQGKPYAVFATAPSMNGYTSVNAAITVNGLKKTLSAKGAVGVFMDAKVIARSPERLIMSGFGDSICRSTAQTDWYLSHRLFGTEYRSVPYDILKEEETILFGNAEGIRHRDSDSIMSLCRVLTLSGFGMTICGGSAPASQGEHMISHFMDMIPPAGWLGAYHGEQIAVTTISSAAIQGAILNGDVPELRASKTTRADVDDTFGADLGALCWAEYEPKRITSENVDEINSTLETTWTDLHRELSTIHIDAQSIRKSLSDAGAPTTPDDLGLTNDYYDKATVFGRTIRNRFSFLDIACDRVGPGILEIARS